MVLIWTSKLGLVVRISFRRTAVALYRAAGESSSMMETQVRSADYRDWGSTEGVGRNRLYIVLCLGVDPLGELVKNAFSFSPQSLGYTWSFLWFCALLCPKDIKPLNETSNLKPSHVFFFKPASPCNDTL